MDLEQLTEAVIRMEEKLDHTLEAITKAATDPGFTRCSARGEMLKGLAKDVGRVEGNQTWLWRSVAVVIIGVAIQTLMLVVKKL
jgi:hypothetical protein